ncbi:hypothetical protein [Amycolatopsis cihanbeyliensis]|uniref:Capsular polysaccharide biosynthesis protein n=1 Tax=Amycolatopsis cihanbeyliensis TaxID=1128664 RepID=A0A542DFF3_AMYCI|nr:hypothetical protein [Amycolatopsis cihanbeyliensis]TQJ01838.1 hypothetical protein FB471_1554 [Amycolatopsis cihanbeyliensis]
MDFWSTLRVLLRRWYVAVPVFAAALGLAGVAYVSVDPQYESTGTIVLTAPSSGARVTVGEPTPAERINPLLAFDASLTTSAQILIETLRDPATVERFTGDSEDALSYEVGNGQLSGPFIVVVATSRTPEGSTRTVAEVLDRAREELRSRQETLEAPESTYIRSEPVISPTPAEELVGGKFRFAAVALFLGLIAGLTAAYGYESYQQHRRRRGSSTTKDRSTKAAAGKAPDGDERGNGEATVTMRSVPGTSRPTPGDGNPQ